MKNFMAFNEQFNVLLIKFNDKEMTESIKEGDVVILKNNDDIIGFNIYNPSIKINNGMCSENKEVQKYVLDTVSGYMSDINFEPQFIVGKIVECEDVQDTHLHLCKVDLGNEIVQIVCGAKNARVGINVICATIGAWMPNGLHILPGKLRGHESFGMLCSIKELNINDDSFNQEGITELDDTKYAVGAAFWEEYNK